MSTLREIVALARSGSPDRAWAAFVASGWDRQAYDPDALTLKGRLLKDQAKRAPRGARRELYRRAGEAYALAAALAPATYPLINAATLSLLSGNPAGARSLAARALHLIDRGVHQPETRYWIEATRSEALLLLDRRDAARDALGGAIAREPAAWEDHAATIGQFALILDAQHADAAWLDRYRPPISLYFRGIIGISPDDVDAAARIGAIVDEQKPGFAFGALASGADILIAEAVVRRSAALHVVLPCPIAAFRAASVTAVDDRWGPRFDALIQIAESIDQVEGDPGPSQAAIAVANRMAMGLTMRNARLLQSRALRLSVVGATDLPPADDVWEDAGNPTRTIRIDRSAAAPFDTDQDGVEPVAVVAIRRADMRTSERTADLPLDPASDIHLITARTPSQALSAARRIAGDSDAALGLDYGLATAGRIDPALAARVITIARAAEQGRWLASAPMAMALELESPRPSIEIGGEVRGPSGVHPIFAVTPR